MRLLSLLFCLPLVAADLPADLQKRISTARTLPPELFADTVIKLVENGAVREVALQKSLLTDAFSAASQAKEPVRLLALPGVATDTKEYFRAKAGELRLDALSLETRAVKILMTVDRPGARQLFESIAKIQADAGVCESAFVADASSYYEAAAAVAQGTFSSAEKEKSEHAQFLSGVLSGVASPAELTGFVRALESVELTASEMQIISGGLESKLAQLGPNYRSFGMTVTKLADGLDFFKARARSLGLSNETLDIAFHRYVVNQMTGPRCAENFQEAERFAPGETLKPSKRGSAFQTKTYFDAERSQELAQSLNKLMFREDGRGYSSEERASTAWKALLANFLRDFQAWTPTGTETDKLHQRMIVLKNLLGLMPASQDRARVGAMASALVEGANNREFPAEWQWELESLRAAAGS